MQAPHANTLGSPSSIMIRSHSYETLLIRLFHANWYCHRTNRSLHNSISSQLEPTGFSTLLYLIRPDRKVDWERALAYVDTLDWSPPEVINSTSSS